MPDIGNSPAIRHHRERRARNLAGRLGLRLEKRQAGGGLETWTGYRLLKDKGILGEVGSTRTTTVVAVFGFDAEYELDKNSDTIEPDLISASRDHLAELERWLWSHPGVVRV
jgi:hypothetical protein